MKFRGLKTSTPEYWANEVDTGRVAVALNTTTRLPKGGLVPEEWWEKLELNAPVTAGSKIRVVRCVHEAVVTAAVPVIVFEDDHVVAVDKPGFLLKRVFERKILFFCFQT